MKIGVFDSGRGGEYVARELQKLFPRSEVRYMGDPQNVPYGSKTPEQIRALTEAAIQPLIRMQCDAIVIACNTATTNAIACLRQRYPTQFFVGIEPMLKPAAALSRSGAIAVCATPATLASGSYRSLKNRYAANVRVVEPDCSSWAALIESGEIDRVPVARTVERLRAQYVDVIVLGCTHYQYLKDTFALLAPDIKILEPTDAIARRVRAQLTAHLRPQ